MKKLNEGDNVEELTVCLTRLRDKDLRMKYELVEKFKKRSLISNKITFLEQLKVFSFFGVGQDSIQLMKWVA